MEEAANRSDEFEIGSEDRKSANPRKASDIIFKDGFAYITQKISGNPPTRYLKCNMRQTTNCPATGKIPLGGGAEDFTPIRSSHNHSPNEGVRLKNEFMALLKNMCANQQSTVRNIYKAAAKIDPEGAKFTSFQVVQTSMRKWQKSSTGSACPQVIILDDSEEEAKKVRGKYKERKPPDVIFKDGFAYVNQKFSGNPPMRYLKCSMRNVTRCTATGKVPVGGTAADFIQIQAEHNHPPNREVEVKTEFKALLKTMCTTQGNAIRSIYSAAEAADPEGARLVPFKTVQSSMWKWQKEYRKWW